MKKITKRILITSAVMAGTGVVLMGAGMALGGWPGVVFTKAGIRSPHEQKAPYSQEKKKIDPFSEINVYIGSEADVRIVSSDDKNYYIEYTLDGDYSKPKYEVKNGKLSFSQEYQDEYMTGVFGMNFGGIGTEASYVTVYIPKGTILEHAEVYTDYGDTEWSNVNGKTVSIEGDCGDLKVKQAEISSLNLVANDGDASIDTVKAGSLAAEFDYGDCTFRDVEGKELSIYSECGDVELEQISSDKITVEALDGDVLARTVSCLTADVTLEYGDFRFDAEKLENLTCSNECGDVDLTLPEAMEQYQFDLQLEYGDLSLPKDAPRDLYREEDGEVSYQTSASEKNKGKKISIVNEDGDVKVNCR